MSMRIVPRLVCWTLLRLGCTDAVFSFAFLPLVLLVSAVLAGAVTPVFAADAGRKRKRSDSACECETIVNMPAASAAAATVSLFM
jgi:hypothetical protein